MTAPVPQPDPNQWFDDPNIEGRVIRICKTPFQVIFDEGLGRHRLSDQVFSALGPGVSVELMGLILDAGETLAQRVSAHTNAFGVVSIDAADVRKIKNKDSKGKDLKALGLAYTPQGPEIQGGPNPFHGDIFPPPSKSANAALTKASQQHTELFNESAAKAACDRRHGKPQ